MKIIDNEAQKIEFLEKAPRGRTFYALSLSENRKVRFSVEKRGTVFVYLPRRRNYGNRYSKDEFCVNHNIIEPVDETVQWHKRLKKAVKCMENSGLWEEIKEVYSNILSSGMTWEDRSAISRLYWKTEISKKSTEEDREEVYSAFLKKYPFAFGRDSDGQLFINTDYIWEMSICSLKPMYFGKGDNKYYKEEIAKAIREKRDYRISRLPVKYDVTFEYSASRNKAWYSEEYRNCGNGHYYLALDHSTALFYEDD